MSAPTTAHAEKSKKQIAYEMLKEKIITNQLAPGTMLVERQLCEMLNSSRTPIREAIQQLSADGLVTSIPTVGSYVSEIRYEYVIQLYDVREYLEGLAAKLCAINITDSQIQALNRCWLNMNDDIRTKEYDKLFQEDSNFHQNIVNYSRNEILQTLYAPLSSQIFRTLDSPGAQHHALTFFKHIKRARSYIIRIARAESYDVQHRFTSRSSYA